MLLLRSIFFSVAFVSSVNAAIDPTQNPKIKKAFADLHEKEELMRKTLDMLGDLPDRQPFLFLNAPERIEHARLLHETSFDYRMERMITFAEVAKTQLKDTIDSNAPFPPKFAPYLQTIATEMAQIDSFMARWQPFEAMRSGADPRTPEEQKAYEKARDAMHETYDQLHVPTRRMMAAIFDLRSVMTASERGQTRFGRMLNRVSDGIEFVKISTAKRIAPHVLELIRKGGDPVDILGEFARMFADLQRPVIADQSKQLRINAPKANELRFILPTHGNMLEVLEIAKRIRATGPKIAIVLAPFHFMQTLVPVIGEQMALDIANAMAKHPGFIDVLRESSDFYLQKKVGDGPNWNEQIMTATQDGRSTIVVFPEARLAIDGGISHPNGGSLRMAGITAAKLARSTGSKIDVKIDIITASLRGNMNAFAGERRSRYFIVDSLSPEEIALVSKNSTLASKLLQTLWQMRAQQMDRAVSGAKWQPLQMLRIDESLANLKETLADIALECAATQEQTIPN